MFTIEEALKQAPVHILYIGSEEELVSSVQNIRRLGRKANLVEITYCDNPRDSVAKLYTLPLHDIPIILCNFFSSLSGDTETVVRYVGAVFNSGHARISFVEAARAEASSAAIEALHL